ncbi:MAG: glycosylase [Solirubrobacterales bacterium]|nr:glycosylase [Solirubrobacterales bacterium]
MVSLPAPVLPDVLAPGLRVVFCGYAPGTASARAGAYYAGPGNRFWLTLHEVGLTPLLLRPAEFTRLPEFGIGLTDVSKTASGSDQEVGRRGVDPERLAAAIEAASPTYLAFNGKNSARATLGRKVGYGRQPERIGGASVWVLPSTSGAARGFWDVGPWWELARAALSISSPP